MRVFASPPPTSVTACPALADALAGSAAVPDKAVDAIDDKVRVNGALVPPDVAAVIAPNASDESGIVMRTRLLGIQDPVGTYDPSTSTFGPASPCDQLPNP